MGIFSADNWQSTVGTFANAIGTIVGSAKSTPQPAYVAEVTKTQSYGQKQGSNLLMYAGMGGMALLLVIIMSTRK